MPKHIYDVTIDGRTYEVASEMPLSEAQAYQAASVEHGKPKPIDANEPDTKIGGMWKGWNEGSRAGLRGFLKGVVPGAVNTVLGAPKALLGAGIETAKGLYNLGTDPETAIRDSYSAVKGIPGKIAKTGEDMATMGARDPEALGHQIGEMTGGTMTGIAASSAVPLLPKPLMRGIGDTMEQMGVKGSWPIKMVGAHQIASGNPMGVLTMMAPAQLAKGGRALRMAGTEAGAAAGTLEGQYLKLHQDIQTGNMATVESRLTALQDDLVKRHAEARLPEQLAEVKKQQLQLDKLRGAAEKRVLAAQKPTPAQTEAIRLDKQKQKDVLDVTDAVEKMHDAAAKRVKEEAKAAAEEAKRVAEVQKAKEGLTPSEPRVTETVRGTTPEGAVHTKTTVYTAEDGAETAAQGPKGPTGSTDPSGPSKKFPGLTNLEVSLLKQQGMSDDIIMKAASQPPLSQPASAMEQAGAMASGPRQTYPIKPQPEGFGTGVSAVPEITAPTVEAPAAPARPKLDLGSADRKLLDDLVTKAKAEGYTGDERALAEHLYDKVTQVKDSLDEFDTAGTNPHQLRQAIKEAGGFNVDKETALGGELENLKSFDKSLVSKGDKGLTVDGMLEHLKQDPRFQHIADINGLLDASKDAAGAGQSTLASKLKTAGVEYGKPWWKQVGQAADDATSFDPVQLEKDLIARDAPPPESFDAGVARIQADRAANPTNYEGRSGLRDATQGMDKTVASAVKQIAPEAPGASANVRTPLYEDFHMSQLEQEMAQRDALRGTPEDVAHSPVAQQVEAARTAAPSALEASMMQTPDMPSLAPSRSRTNAAKGGLTSNDVTALKKFVLENPDADPEMIAAHLADQRASRSAAYRTNAGLDKGAKLALELDNK